MLQATALELSAKASEAVCYLQAVLGTGAGGAPGASQRSRAGTAALGEAAKEELGCFIVQIEVREGGLGLTRPWPPPEKVKGMG